MDLFRCIKAIAGKNLPVMVSFSGGKDSIVTLDLVAQYVKDFQVVHHYFYKKLEYREPIFEFYEKRIGKKIIRLPSVGRKFYLERMGLKTKIKDDIKLTENYEKKKFGVVYHAYGHRLAESLTRRAMLKKFTDGINENTKRVYPVLYYKKAHIYQHIKNRKLKLPIEYSFSEYGMSDVSLFTGEALLWLYNNFRQDYYNIVEEFPCIEQDLKKIQWEYENY